MAEATTAATKATQKKAAPTDLAGKRKLRKKLRTEGRKARATKLKSDSEFAKAYFGGKSKRAAEKKQAFRRKSKGKK